MIPTPLCTFKLWEGCEYISSTNPIKREYAVFLQQNYGIHKHVGGIYIRNEKRRGPRPGERGKAEARARREASGERGEASEARQGEASEARASERRGEAEAEAEAERARLGEARRASEAAAGAEARQGEAKARRGQGKARLDKARRDKARPRPGQGKALARRLTFLDSGIDPGQSTLGLILGCFLLEARKRLNIYYKGRWALSPGVTWATVTS
ncbi:hypothetical protein Sjap_008967 [Stephania japonica]|uniref:Uncharacterized protein n=1 Tax=Stephania japonica TaxID=461633 RepID=A0AAP0JQJ7_9MAGN